MLFAEAENTIILFFVHPKFEESLKRNRKQCLFKIWVDKKEHCGIFRFAIVFDVNRVPLCFIFLTVSNCDPKTQAKESVNEAGLT